jgi:hypothetical protein
MDWANNSVIFSFLNDKKNLLEKTCDYCSLKCSCYVDIDLYTTQSYGKQKKLILMLMNLLKWLKTHIKDI